MSEVGLFFILLVISASFIVPVALFVAIRPKYFLRRLRECDEEIASLQQLGKLLPHSLTQRRVAIALKLRRAYKFFGDEGGKAKKVLV